MNRLTGVMRIFVVATAAIIILLPWLYVTFRVPSTREIVSAGVLPIGSITTGNNVDVDVQMLVGDIFDPKSTSRDVGFDLVAVSCYFDPVAINRTLILPGNPMLFSALRDAARTEAEFQTFVEGLLTALRKSSKVVSQFVAGDASYASSGDPLTPHVWARLNNSPTQSIQGVKYEAALPLFNPDILRDKVSPDVARGRLALNVESSVDRLLTSYLPGEATVQSVAFPSLGSTSHRGGDSPYFMTFEQGFRYILNGVTKARPPPTLSRVYLVGFRAHTGDFRSDLLDGMQSAARYMAIRDLAHISELGVCLAVTSLLFTLLGVCSYHNVRTIFRDKARWPIIANVAQVGGLLGACVSGILSFTAHLAPPDHVEIALIAYSMCAIAGVILVLWFSKRIRTSPRSTKSP